MAIPKCATRRATFAICVARWSRVSGACKPRGESGNHTERGGFRRAGRTFRHLLPRQQHFLPATRVFRTNVDEGGGMFRDTLLQRISDATGPIPRRPRKVGWRRRFLPATPTAKRSEPVQMHRRTRTSASRADLLEYSFDFRTDPTFQGTSNFCHIFQLKATNGDDSPLLATISLYKSGALIQGRVDCFTDGDSTAPTTKTSPPHSLTPQASGAAFRYPHYALASSRVN